VYPDARDGRVSADVVRLDKDTPRGSNLASPGRSCRWWSALLAGSCDGSPLALDLEHRLIGPAQDGGHVVAGPVVTSRE
jgi:hypothetical protein